ncbi:MAG: shikimate kinase, partial [Lachnospiraceae bacterium]|nr:shikimate kinase [Lachnospiraceae bacterium]
KEIGTVVYIKLDYEEIEERLGDLHQRGVAVRGDMTLRDLFDERVPLYEKYADVICEADGKVLREVVLDIKSKLL